MTRCDLGDGSADGGCDTCGGNGPGTDSSPSSGGSTGFIGPIGCNLMGSAVGFGVCSPSSHPDNEACDLGVPDCSCGVAPPGALPIAKCSAGANAGTKSAAVRFVTNLGDGAGE